MTKTRLKRHGERSLGTQTGEYYLDWYPSYNRGIFIGLENNETTKYLAMLVSNTTYHSKYESRNPIISGHYIYSPRTI